MRRINRIKKLSLLICSLAVILTGCTKKNTQAIFEMGNASEPKSLDPLIAVGVPEFHIIISLFEGLVQIDNETAEPIPGVAEKWEISKDGTEYTFHLRKNAKWSNGDPVTAHDFVYGFTRLLNPATGSQYAYQGYYIKNGQAFNSGQIRDPNLLGVKALDDSTLKITLEGPTPFFLGLLWHHSLYPLHKKTVETYGMKWTKPENIVTNGPFLLDKWELNKVVSVKRNPHYWNPDAVKLDGINFHPIESRETEEKMFRAGKLHLTYEVPLEKIPHWREDKSGAFVTAVINGNYYYNFNVTKKPLDDARVRKALSYAVDRENLVNLVTRGGQVAANSFSPPGCGGFVSKPLHPTSLGRLEEAKKLLAEAGYPGGKGFPKIEILYNTAEEHKKIALAIAEMWRKNLGIDVGLYNQEWKTFLNTKRMLNFSISRAAWIGDFNDPLTFLELLRTKGGNNETGWSNARFDELLDLAGRTNNKEKRLQYFQEMEDLIAKEMPLMPLYTFASVHLKDPKLVGWYPNIMDWHPYLNMYLKN